MKTVPSHFNTIIIIIILSQKFGRENNFIIINSETFNRFHVIWNHWKHISQDFTTKTNLGEILKWFGCSPERERERESSLSIYAPHMLGNYAPESGC